MRSIVHPLRLSSLPPDAVLAGSSDPIPAELIPAGLISLAAPYREFPERNRTS